MGLQIDDIILDGVTSDPTSPVNGEMWFRSDTNEWRFRKNGQTKKLASKGTGTSEEDVAQCKCDATTAPVGTNDSSEGYTASSLWIDVTADKAYICVDDTATSAIWIEVTQTGGGLAAADIDTLAELNAIITDATLIDTADARLSDSRTCDNTFDNAATARTNLGVDAAGTDNAPDATTTVKGKVEKSTSAENVAGTSDLVYPTVAGTKEMIDTHAGGGSTPFSPEKTNISGDATATWVSRSLGAGYANKELQIIIEQTTNTFQDCGVREVGSSLDLYFRISRGSSTRTVVADASGDIEIYAGSLDATFWIIGTK